jgi:hypothetical protein
LEAPRFPKHRSPTHRTGTAVGLISVTLSIHSSTSVAFLPASKWLQQGQTAVRLEGHCRDNEQSKGGERIRSPHKLNLASEESFETMTAAEMITAGQCYCPSDLARTRRELPAQGTQLFKPRGGVTHDCRDADHPACIVAKRHDRKLDRDPCAVFRNAGTDRIRPSP